MIFNVCKPVPDLFSWWVCDHFCSPSLYCIWASVCGKKLAAGIPILVATRRSKL